MKILKHGDLKPRKFICDDCGCEFVADKTEYQISEFQTNITLLVTYHAQCPDCSHIIRASADEASLYDEKGAKNESKTDN